MNIFLEPRPLVTPLLCPIPLPESGAFAMVFKGTSGEGELLVHVPMVKQSEALVHQCEENLCRLRIL